MNPTYNLLIFGLTQVIRYNGVTVYRTREEWKELQWNL